MYLFVFVDHAGLLSISKSVTEHAAFCSSDSGIPPYSHLGIMVNSLLRPINILKNNRPSIKQDVKSEEILFRVELIASSFVIQSPRKRDNAFKSIVVFLIPQGENYCSLFGFQMGIYLSKTVCDNYKTAFSFATNYSNICIVLGSNTQWRLPCARSQFFLVPITMESSMTLKTSDIYMNTFLSFLIFTALVCCSFIYGFQI